MKTFMNMMGAGASAAALCGDMGAHGAHALQLKTNRSQSERTKQHYNELAANKIFNRTLRCGAADVLVRDGPYASYTTATGQEVDNQIKAARRAIVAKDFLNRVFIDGAPRGSDTPIGSTCSSRVTAQSSSTARSGRRGSSPASTQQRRVLRTAAEQSLKPASGTRQQHGGNHRNSSRQVKGLIC